MIPYSATTEDIEVTVRPVYLDGQSDVMNRRFVFGYFVRIVNHSASDVQLLRRHWYIHDSSGKIQEVDGEGVTGQQPLISPGQSHEYSSFCVLGTFSGHMEGFYLMERERGDRFHITIPKFSLQAAAN